MSSRYITRNLRQTVTYWSPASKDKFGRQSFGAPATQKGRWEDRQSLFIDGAGNEVRSDARVYLTSDVSLGGWIFLGGSTEADPTSVSGAREIVDFRKTPNLRADAFERQALLKKVLF